MSKSAGPIEQGNRPTKNRRLKASLVPSGRMLPFTLVTVLFFLWGVPNNLNDILISQFMKSFEMNRLQAGLVQFAFYLGYFFLAIPAAQLMRRAGYKASILAGLVLYGHRVHPFLAGCDDHPILVFPVGAVCHRQRSLVS